MIGYILLSFMAVAFIAYMAVLIASSGDGQL